VSGRASSSDSTVPAAASRSGSCDPAITVIKREVCADDMTPADARWWIVNDWRDAP
jgi:hypothetical protein